MVPRPELLHTRLLTVRLSPAGDGSWQVDARILDVRRRGVVTLLGAVNGPGVVHDMRVNLVLDGDHLRILEAALAMPSVPFPPDAAARETCRDNEPSIVRLVGLSLRHRFSSGLQRTIGGPRGCFHVFTLMRLVAPSILFAVDGVRRLGEGGTFSRALVIDAFRTADGLRLAGRLTDLQHASVGSPFEGEADVEVHLPRFTVVGVEARRRTGPPTVGSWTSDGLGALGDLRGESLLRGYGLKVGALLPADASFGPMRELVLMLQPVAFQCMPALAEERTRVSGGRRSGPVAGIDSCSMWRRGGPLLAALEARAGAH
jgi:hypothetical protein